MYYEQKEEEAPVQEKRPIVTTVQLTKKIDEILESQNFKELNILKQSLLAYKKELDELVTHGIPMEHEKFKKNLHSHLERLLLFIIYIPNNQIRDDKIRQIYRWYFDKLEKWDSLDKISYRTDKNPDEIYIPEELPSDDILIQDEDYEMEQFKLHRTNIPGLEPPKDRLKSFEVKKVNPPKKFKKDEKTMADLRFNLERFHGKVGTGNSSISLKSTFYATKTGQQWFSHSGIGVNEELKPINPKREIKSAYAYARPNYEHSRLVVEKEIQIAKNKEIMEKRNKEEMKKYLEDYGKAKAKFNEKKERKNYLQSIVNVYEKGFKVDKDVDELIKEEEHDEEEKNENNNLNMNIQGHVKVSSNVTENNSNNISSIKPSSAKSEIIPFKFEGPEPNNKTILRNKVCYTRIENLPKKEAKVKQLMEKPKTDFKIESNLNRDFTLENNRKNQEITGKVKNDEVAFGTVNDKVLKARLLSAKMCNVNIIDRPKLGYVQHYTPLSAFDYKNYDEYAPEVPKPKPKLTRPKTASEFASRHYKKYEDNLLGLRIKMGEFIENEQGTMDKVNFEKMEKLGGIENVEYPDINSASGSGVLKTKVKNEFKVEPFRGEYNPAFGDLMSRPFTSKPVSLVYLPRPGSGLLIKPEEKKGKKKKRAKKK